MSFLTWCYEVHVVLCLLCLHSSLARALQPSVLMQMKLSDGSLQRFEVLKNELDPDCTGSFTFSSKYPVFILSICAEV